MKEPRRYRRRPSEIDAIRYLRSNEEAVIDFCGKTASGANRARPVTSIDAEGRKRLLLRLLAGPGGVNGDVDVPLGHWVAKVDDDHLYPIDHKSFTALWEEI